MGFFSDLKDDLSQAVNELKPEENPGASGDILPENGDAQELQGSIITSQELSDMLDKVEAMSAETDIFNSEADTAGELSLQEEIQAELPVEPLSVDEALLTEEPQTEIPVELPMVEEALAETISELPLVEEEPVETLMMDESILAEEGLAEEIQVELPDDATSVETMESDTPDGVVNELREEVQEGMSEEVMEEVLETNEVEQEQGGEETIMDTQPKVASDETAVVTEGMSIIGDITSGGSLELLGAVTGNIDVLGKLNITGSIQGNSKAAEIFAEGARINGEINSQGSVKIGQSSVIIGNIYANSAVIAGAVKGDIDVHGPVVLDTSAIVMGNIKSKSVQINNGAVIEGMCSQCYAEINPTSFFEEIKKKKDKK